MTALAPKSAIAADAPPPFGLTRNMLICLNVINDLTEATGVPPTITEIASEMDIAARSGVHRLIEKLKARGWIATVPYAARSIAILQPVPALEEPVFVLADDTAGPELLAQLPPPPKGWKIWDPADVSPA